MAMVVYGKAPDAELPGAQVFARRPLEAIVLRSVVNWEDDVTQVLYELGAQRRVVQFIGIHGR